MLLIGIILFCFFGGILAGHIAAKLCVRFKIID